MPPRDRLADPPGPPADVPRLIIRAHCTLKALAPWMSVGFISALLACTHLFFMRGPLLVDEYAHVRQIHTFLTWSLKSNPDITMIPGYHVILAALAGLTGWRTDASLRSFSFLFGIGCVVLVARLTRSAYRSLLFACLPIIFPFFFLVYTDIASLFFVLLGLYLVSLRRYTLGGFAAIAACAIRQNNIVWLAFLGVFSYLGTLAGSPDRHIWQRHVKTLWSFGLGMILFLLFLLSNRGSASLGDERSHPTGPLHMTNIWFMLALFGLLFLPFALPRAFETLRRFGRARSFWAGASGLFLLYLATFTNTHPYNLQWSHYILRNAILISATRDLAHKTLFFIPVSIAVAALCSTPLHPPVRYLLLYPATVLFLLPSWLVEQRYYIIPYTLFIVLAPSCFLPDDTSSRTPTRTIVAWTWIALLLAASLVLLLLMAQERVFL